MASTSVSETILKNVRVLAVDQTVEEKNGQKVVVGKTATLELAPRQTEILANGRQKGTLSLALRSIVDGAGKAEGGDRRGRYQPGVNIIRFGINRCAEVNPDTHDRHLKYGQGDWKRTTNMAKRTLIRTASFAALIAMAGTALVNFADAADRRVSPRAPIDAHMPMENGDR